MRATDFYSADDYYAALEERWATDSEAMAEHAAVAGAYQPDREWLLDDRDVWVRNPHYRGAPGRHPEDDRDDDDGSPIGPVAPTDFDEIPF